MVPIQIYHSDGIVQNYGFFKREEFQPMASAPDDTNNLLSSDQDTN